MESVRTVEKNQNFLARIYQGLCRPYVNSLLAAEISSLSRYFDSAVQVAPRPEDEGALFSLIDCPGKATISAAHELMTPADPDHRQLVFFNGNFNHHFDIEGLLRELHPRMERKGRISVVVYNTYLRGLFLLANRMGVRQAEMPSTFFTQEGLENIANLAGFEIVRARPVGYFPLRLFGLGDLLNRILQSIPFFRWFALAEVVTLRPEGKVSELPSLSVVIPARNERGNIENALRRMPAFDGARLEVIFVEGHSSDGTWEEILRVQEAWKDRFDIRAFRQSGRGKADAVRLGFSKARSELLTILDADLTMPPELLTRFYDAYRKGLADFINGSRLVYPMEGEAMRFLNWLGNIFFAKALGFVLDARLGDSLCGTKLVSRTDYARFVRWRKDFGDFDPFGDFELIFPAVILGLGLVDIPIRYRARTYGTTNIHRFRHGFILLKMTLIGLLKIRMGRTVRLP